MTDHDAFLAEMSDRADRAHAATPGADQPPAHHWQHVLNQIESSPQETHTMPSMTVIASPMLAGQPGARDDRRGLSHYANRAAMLVIIATLAFGGWFAAMQLQQPGGPDSRLAAVTGTPVAGLGVCDVEPLTVDEVMAIVRNPYRYLHERAKPDLPVAQDLAYAAEPELMEALVMMSYTDFTTANRTQPSAEDFAEASTAVNAYLACAPGATNGQLWAFYDPTHVQTDILDHFPVFADEASVRTYVEENIDQPAHEPLNRFDGFTAAYGDITVTANADIEYAEQVLVSSARNEPVIALGVLITDANGEVVMETSGSGYPLQLRPGALPQRPVVVVTESPVTGEWYVLPWFGN